MAGVLGTHRERMADDESYRDAALESPHSTRGKYLTNTAPTVGKADRDEEADDSVRSEVQEPRSFDE